MLENAAMPLAVGVLVETWDADTLARIGGTRIECSSRGAHGLAAPCGWKRERRQHAARAFA
eukprot:5887048-Prymnesium_polylepis.1